MRFYTSYLSVVFNPNHVHSERNKIIADLFNSKEFNDCIKKMQPVELQDDLKAEVALILCEKEDAVIISLNNAGPMALKYYTVRIILNLIQSNTSPFYKKYRQPIIEYAENVNDAYELTEDEIDARIAEECKEEQVLKIIEDLYWYDKEMLKLYMETGNYRTMEKETGIPHGTCYDAIQAVYAKIRYHLRMLNKQKNVNN